MSYAIAIRGPVAPAAKSKVAAAHAAAVVNKKRPALPVKSTGLEAGAHDALLN